MSALPEATPFPARSTGPEWDENGAERLAPEPQTYVVSDAELRGLYLEARIAIAALKKIARGEADPRQVAREALERTKRR